MTTSAEAVSTICAKQDMKGPNSLATHTDGGWITCNQKASKNMIIFPLEEKRKPPTVYIHKPCLARTPK